PTRYCLLKSLPMNVAVHNAGSLGCAPIIVEFAGDERSKEEYWRANDSVISIAYAGTPPSICVIVIGVGCANVEPSAPADCAGVEAAGWKCPRSPACATPPTRNAPARIGVTKADRNAWVGLDMRFPRAG